MVGFKSKTQDFKAFADILHEFRSDLEGRECVSKHVRN